ncbi:Histidine kinase [Agyrium rufum]|nr:Histidine kinase [Agyrium rufum]
MRIAIREQLGLLVLLCCLVSLAVVAVATWVTNYQFVVGIRLSSLSLTASLYSEQLRSNLNLLGSSVQATSTRVLIQNALQRYNSLGNDTDANWVRAQSDLEIALTGVGTAQYLLQAVVVSKNGTGSGGRYGLLNATGTGLAAPISLPYTYSNGSSVFLGDPGLGYPPPLYPNLTYTSTPLNSTFNVSNAYFGDQPLFSNSSLFLGPWQLNDTFALCSITVPIINNTSTIDILGWLTVVLNAQVVFDIENALEGLESTGVVLIVGPDTPSNKFPSGIMYDSTSPNLNKPAADSTLVRFVLPPAQDPSRSKRHSQYKFGGSGQPFALRNYPGVERAVIVNNNALNNADSIFSTTNEEGDSVSVGFAMPSSSLVDWVVVIEQEHSEVVQPINHLRNVLLACVFGTAGGIILLIFPLAHYCVMPIRRLRAATKKTVDPISVPSDHNESVASFRSIGHHHPPDDGDEPDETLARKEGFFERFRMNNPMMRRRGRSDLSKSRSFRIPAKVQDRKHIIQDELTDLTSTFNEMCEELMMQYERLEERVRERTAELELSKKAAEAANESKTLFIANISHELKTPLNGILGMTAVCMSEDDPSKIKRSLGIIYKSGDLLLHLLTDLLTFSKNQIGQQNLTLDEKEFRLIDISTQIMNIFEKQVKESAIHLRLVFEGPHESLETASGTPGQAGFGPYGTGRVRDMCVWGDQHRILQVIINLVSNSLKFTPPDGSVTIRIRCVGEFDLDKPPSSRKGSTQSKQSKQSKKSSNRVGWVARGRMASSSDASVISTSPMPELERTRSDYTSLEMNAREPKTISQVHVRERSTSPPPLNVRTLLFEFEVEDTGPGIPPSQQQKVFEPFVQGDLGLSKKYGGTGLGLSICSQLASLMRGRIHLRSELGAGTTFTMRIPLKFTKERAASAISSQAGTASRRNSGIYSGPDDQQGAAHGSSSDLSIKSDDGSKRKSGFESPASKPRLVGLSAPFFATTPPLETAQNQLEAMERVAAEAARAGDKVRVLVAEDNIVNQEVVLRMLKLEDIYDVTVAKDGQEAYEFVKQSMEQHKLYNLIFMDIQMPNLDGLQSTRLIREMGYSAPIVALTAFAEESNVKECLDSGMDFFLPKPIRRPALKQVLKRYCATIPEAEETDTNSVAVATTNGTSSHGRFVSAPPTSAQSSVDKDEPLHMKDKTPKLPKGAEMGNGDPTGLKPPLDTRPSDEENISPLS